MFDWTHSNPNLFASALPGKQKKQQQHLECETAHLYFLIFSHQQEVFNYVNYVSKRSQMQWWLGKSADELETEWSRYSISCCLSCHSLTKGNATASDIFILASISFEISATALLIISIMSWCCSEPDGRYSCSCWCFSSLLWRQSVVTRRWPVVPEQRLLAAKRKSVPAIVTWNVRCLDNDMEELHELITHRGYHTGSARRAVLSLSCNNSTDAKDKLLPFNCFSNFK